MDNKTMESLLGLGFDKEWLEMVKTKFAPTKKGRFKIQIFDIEDPADEPETGIFVEETRFSTERELSIIHFFFEGLAYVMIDSESKEEIGRGIIDGAPFDEIEEAVGEHWNWLSPKKLGHWYNEQRKQELEKLEQRSLAKLKEAQ